MNDCVKVEMVILQSSFVGLVFGRNAVGFYGKWDDTASTFQAENGESHRSDI